MTEYLIAVNDEWVPGLTPGELREKSKTTRALVAEMKAAGVFVYTNGGLVPETPVFSVDASSGEPLFTDGPYVETKEHLGGFLVVDVPDEASARHWAGGSPPNLEAVFDSRAGHRQFPARPSTDLPAHMGRDVSSGQLSSSDPARCGCTAAASPTRPGTASWRRRWTPSRR
jgi:hypothetical protein